MSFDASTDTPATYPAAGSFVLGMKSDRTGEVFNIADFVTKGSDGNYRVPGSTLFLNSDKLIVQHDGSDVYIRANNSGSIVYLGANNANLWQLQSGALKPTTDNSQALGGSSNRVSVVFAATGSINTSDERDKREIGAIPDAWLDAWGEVDWCRFKFNDGQRWHAGLVAQRVHAAFAMRGIDAFEIGLCCFDEWPAEPAREAVRDKETNALISAAVPARPAGDRWGLRYDECFALEAAWQRRELTRQVARIAALEAAAG